MSKAPIQITIRNMQYLIAVKENDFNCSHADLDIGVETGTARKMMNKIEDYMGFTVFLKGDRKWHDKGKAFVGFTDKGQELYFSIKTFIGSIALIGE